MSKRAYNEAARQTPYKSRRETPHVSHRLKAAWSLLTANPLVTRGELPAKEFAESMSQLEITLQGALSISGEDRAYSKTISDMMRSDPEGFKQYLTSSGQAHLCLATAGKFIAEMLGVEDFLRISWDKAKGIIIVTSMRNRAVESPPTHRTGLQKPSFRDICAVGTSVQAIPQPAVESSVSPKEKRPRGNRGGAKKREAIEAAKTRGEPIRFKQPRAILRRSTEGVLTYPPADDVAVLVESLKNPRGVGWETDVIMKEDSGHSQDVDITMKEEPACSHGQSIKEQRDKLREESWDS